jgi:hypothetical protein|tara:strand:- start:84 stop:314 length:231 start_codon:yes stop_codon:yes gene_type:complete
MTYTIWWYVHWLIFIGVFVADHKHNLKKQTEDLAVREELLEEKVREWETISQDSTTDWHKDSVIFYRYGQDSIAGD